MKKIINKVLTSGYTLGIIYKSREAIQFNPSGSVGTGRRARLRILCLLQACGFKSRLPHNKKTRALALVFFVILKHGCEPDHDCNASGRGACVRWTPFAKRKSTDRACASRRESSLSSAEISFAFPLKGL